MNISDYLIINPRCECNNVICKRFEGRKIVHVNNLYQDVIIQMLGLEKYRKVVRFDVVCATCNIYYFTSSKKYIANWLKEFYNKHKSLPQQSRLLNCKKKWNQRENKQ